MMASYKPALDQHFTFTGQTAGHPVFAVCDQETVLPENVTFQIV